MLNILSISNISYILGNNQTFLGVLVSVIVLFIIANESNFIHNLLAEVLLKIKNQACLLCKAIGLDSIIDSNDFKCLNYFLVSDRDDCPELKEEGAELIATITSKHQDLQFKHLDIVDFNKKLDSILDSKMHSLAPLYTVLFSLAVFIFDAVSSSSIINNYTFISISFSIFLCFSYIFWIIAYSTFIRNFRSKLCPPKKIEPNSKSYISKISLSYGNSIEYLNKKSIYLTFSLRSIILLLLFWVISSVLLHFGVSSDIAVYLISIPPLVLVGAFRIYLKTKSTTDLTIKYTYLFIGCHFAMIIAFSLASALIIYSRFYQGMLDTFSISILQKIGFFVFVFLNGILLPFAIPYYLYCTVYGNTKKEYKTTIEEANRLRAELSSQLSSFCKRIPNP